MMGKSSREYIFFLFLKSIFNDNTSSKNDVEARTEAFGKEVKVKAHI